MAHNAGTRFTGRVRCGDAPDTGTARGRPRSPALHVESTGGARLGGRSTREGDGDGWSRRLREPSDDVPVAFKMNHPRICTLETPRFLDSQFTSPGATPR